MRQNKKLKTLLYYCLTQFAIIREKKVLSQVKTFDICGMPVIKLNASGYAMQYATRQTCVQKINDSYPGILLLKLIIQTADMFEMVFD